MKTINWTSQQKAFFNHATIGQGNVILRARAGTGKTTTIIEALNRCNATSALYVVFNKRIQEEAQKKITNKNVAVRTAHSVGFGFILANWRGVKANASCEFFRMKKLYSDAPSQVLFQAAKLVSFLKNTFITPNEKDALDTAILRDVDCSQKDIGAGWTQAKLAEMAIKSINLSTEFPADRQISFDDMVWLPLRQGWIKPSYHLCMGDESQDFNTLQFQMLIQCCYPSGRVFLVGDDRQCIYYFRGAQQDGLDKFKLELKAKEFPLTVTYRCGKSIVRLAQELVPDIEHAPDAIEGEIIDCDFDAALTTIKPLDALLSRKNAPLTKACLKLIQKNIPAYIEGREIAKQLIDLIDALEAKDIQDFLNKLDSWLAAKQAKATTYNATKALDTAIDTAETIRAISDNCLTVESVKQKINSIFFDSEYVRKPSVVCSSVHKAKGREWNNVYLLMESFSGGKQTINPQEVQEELNIKYVAITRAKEKLIRIN